MVENSEKKQRRVKLKKKKKRVGQICELDAWQTLQEAQIYEEIKHLQRVILN